MPYFHSDPSTKIQKNEREMEKLHRYIQGITNIYKLTWLTQIKNSNSEVLILLIHCLFNSGNSF